MNSGGKHRADQPGYNVTVHEIIDLLGVAQSMLRDSLKDDHQFEHRDNATQAELSGTQLWLDGDCVRIGFTRNPVTARATETL